MAMCYKLHPRVINDLTDLLDSHSNLLLTSTGIIYSDNTVQNPLNQPISLELSVISDLRVLGTQEITVLDADGYEVYKATPILIDDAVTTAEAPVVRWDNIPDKPTTFTPSTHVHAWADITSGKPTTVAGYGITDAFTQALADARYPQLSIQYTNPTWLAGIDATTIKTGTIDLARLPALPSANTIVCTTIPAMSAGDQLLVSKGTVVIESTTGNTYRYSGTGSVVLTASYIQQSDLTPDWAVITNKPTNVSTWANDAGYLTATSSLAWGKLTGVPATFTPSAHTHLWANITDKPSTFAPSAHTHAQAEITGLETRLTAIDNNWVNYVRVDRASWTRARNYEIISEGEDAGGFVTHFSADADCIRKENAGLSAGSLTFGYASEVQEYAKYVGTGPGGYVRAGNWRFDTLKVGGVDVSTTAHTHTFASLTSKPTTLAGYGITDAASSSHTHTFASLTSKPTTLAGYGITDAQSALGFTPVQQGGGTSQTTNKIFIGWSAAGRLRVQVDTTDFATSWPIDINGNSNYAATAPWSGISGKPTTLAGYGITDAASSTHTHTFASLTSKPTTLSGYGITDAVSSSDSRLTDTRTPTNQAWYVYGDNSTGSRALTDFNAIVKSGFGSGASATGSPTTGWYHIITNKYAGDTIGWLFQIAAGFGTTASPAAAEGYYVRIKEGTSAPTAWRKLWHDGNFDTNRVTSLETRMTGVDNNWTNYLAKSGGTMNNGAVITMNMPSGGNAIQMNGASWTGLQVSTTGTTNGAYITFITPGGTGSYWGVQKRDAADYGTSVGCFTIEDNAAGANAARFPIWIAQGVSGKINFNRTLAAGNIEVNSIYSTGGINANSGSIFTNSSVTAGSFIMSGGTATGFLMSNGTKLEKSVLNYFADSTWPSIGVTHGWAYTGAASANFGFSASNGVVDVYTDGNFYATDNKYRVWHAGDFSISNFATSSHTHNQLQASYGNETILAAGYSDSSGDLWIDYRGASSEIKTHIFGRGLTANTYSKIKAKALVGVARTTDYGTTVYATATGLRDGIIKGNESTAWINRYDYAGFCGFVVSNYEFYGLTQDHGNNDGSQLSIVAGADGGSIAFFAGKPVQLTSGSGNGLYQAPKVGTWTNSGLTVNGTLSASGIYSGNAFIGTHTAHTSWAEFCHQNMKGSSTGYNVLCLSDGTLNLNAPSGKAINFSNNNGASIATFDSTGFKVNGALVTSGLIGQWNTAWTRVASGRLCEDAYTGEDTLDWITRMGRGNHWGRIHGVHSAPSYFNYMLMRETTGTKYSVIGCAADGNWYVGAAAFNANLTTYNKIWTNADFSSVAVNRINNSDSTHGFTRLYRSDDQSKYYLRHGWTSGQWYGNSWRLTCANDLGDSQSGINTVAVDYSVASLKSYSLIDAGKYQSNLDTGFKDNSFGLWAGSIDAPTGTTPFGSSWTWLQEWGHGDGGWRAQMGIHYFSDSLAYRRKENGTWQPWKYVVTTDYVGTISNKIESPRITSQRSLITAAGTYQVDTLNDIIVVTSAGVTLRGFVMDGVVTIYNAQDTTVIYDNNGSLYYQQGTSRNGSITIPARRCLIIRGGVRNYPHVSLD